MVTVMLKKFQGYGTIKEEHSNRSNKLKGVL